MCLEQRVVDISGRVHAWHVRRRIGGGGEEGGHSDDEHGEQGIGRCWEYDGVIGLAEREGGGEEGGGGPGNPIHPKLSSIKGKLSGCTQQHIVAR